VTDVEVYYAIRDELRRERAGVASGQWGIVCGLLGIFTIGGIFVPIAAWLTLCSLGDSLRHRNSRGIALGVFSLIVTAIGFAVSPAAWIEVAAVLTWITGH
jgi:hypothetical protein